MNLKNPNSIPQPTDSEDMHELSQYWLEGDCFYYEQCERRGSTYYRYTIENGQLGKFSQCNKRFMYILVCVFAIFFAIGFVPYLMSDFSWENVGIGILLTIGFYIYLSSPFVARNTMRQAWDKYQNRITRI